MDCFSLEKSLFPLSYSGSQKDGEREAREAHLPARARKLVEQEQTMHLASSLTVFMLCLCKIARNGSLLLTQQFCIDGANEGHISGCLAPRLPQEDALDF